MQLLTACLLYQAFLLGVPAASILGSPFERFGFESSEAQLDKVANPLVERSHRHTRSATGGVPCVTPRFLSELQDRFRSWFDKNKDGLADFQEVKNNIRRYKPNVKDSMVEAFIRRRDSNGNGVIDFVPEYVQDMSSPDYSLEGAKEWFALQDTNDDGAVSEEELTNMAHAVGMSEDAARETVKGYYMPADLNRDGQLSFDEFKNLYTPNP